MRGTTGYWMLSAAAIIFGVGVFACSSIHDEPKAAAQKTAQEVSKAPAAKSAQAQTKSTKSSAKKAVQVEGVISGVGQRTITFQVERKGKIREEVVGVDDKTDIEKGGNKVKLKDLETTDKALINYEPEAYTPALAIRVTGKGKLKKSGGDD